MKSVAERDYVTVDLGADAPATLTGLDLQAYIGQLEKRMREAAANLEFEEAARLRDEIRRLEAAELGVQLNPTGRADSQRGRSADGRSRAQRMAKARRQRSGSRR